MSRVDSLSRRELLSAVGAAAIAGCTERERSYWENPPEFTTDGLDSALHRSLPTRPAITPVSLTQSTVSRHRERIENLLEPIPDPLSDETLPNATIRTQIVESRDRARRELEQLANLRRHRGNPPALSVIERLVTARSEAAIAVGTWAAVTESGSPTAIARSVQAVLETIESFGDSLPGPGRTIGEGATIYGAIERWLDVARRSTLVGGPRTVAEQPNPVRTGRMVGDIERVQAQIDLGRYLTSRYVEMVDGGLSARELERALEETLASIAPEIEERLRALHGADEGDELKRPIRYPDSDVYLDRSDLPDDAPSARLLSRRMGEFFDDARFDPIALPGYSPTHPATTFRRTYRMCCYLNAFDVVGNRLEEGTAFSPSDGDAIAEARSNAIDAVETLCRSDVDLERWMGRRLIPTFEEPDSKIRTAIEGQSENDQRSLTRAYTDYRWISVLVGVIPEATHTFEDAGAQLEK